MIAVAPHDGEESPVKSIGLRRCRTKKEGGIASGMV
jgi:hypothetical protein